VLGPAELGVLGSIGFATPECRRPPSVSVLCTGDELRGPEEPLGPGEIRNSNALTLPALARATGATVADVARVGDDADLTRERLRAALGADVAVISGGVSVGEHDHVKGALAELGVEQVFWGVALRPGKPTYFGVHQGRLVFGLPGNPVSAMVTFLLFARPALLALQGADPGRMRTTATLASALPRLASRDQAVRCRLEASDEGWRAIPTGAQGSHVLTSMLGADGLAEVVAGEGDLAAGSRVDVELIRAPATTASTAP
jgi:molybdopterin molybdotransferase